MAICIINKKNRNMEKVTDRPESSPFMINSQLWKCSKSVW